MDILNCFNIIYGLQLFNVDDLLPIHIEDLKRSSFLPHSPLPFLLDLTAMEEFPLLFKPFLLAGSSFIGSVKLVTAPSQNLHVATPGPASSHNAGLGRPLTPDANAWVTKENPRNPALCIFVCVCGAF